MANLIVFANRSIEADYSAVDSREKARRLVELGELAELLLFPAAFGGDARPENVVYVPQAFADRKAEFEDTIIVPMVQQGTPVEYSVTPEHEGRSFVPGVVNVDAYGPQPHHLKLVIWGAAWRQLRR